MQNDGPSSSTPSPATPSTDFPAYLTSVTSALDALTTHAASLPVGSDLRLHSTLDRGFARELRQASRKVLRMTQELLERVDPGKGRQKLEQEEDVVDGYRRGVVGAVEGLLEDADSNLDELSGQKKKAAIHVPLSIAGTASQSIAGPFSAANSTTSFPVLKRSPRTPIPTIFATANIPKPQLTFPDAVDNSLTRPRSNPPPAFKHHAMVPSGFEVPLDYEVTEVETLYLGSASWRNDREVALRRHPYFYETRHLPYPTSMLTSSPPIVARPIEETEVEVVDTPEQLERMVEVLKQAKEIAVDLEHHDTRSYYGFTCLIQISTRERDWLVDPLALRGELREGKLGGVLADPSVVKIFHGSDSDIVWLQKDFDMFVVNLFDTYHATKVLDYPAHSLASLLQLFCGYITDKQHQMADWRIRPLPEPLSVYARSDTHFLLSIYDQLRNALLETSKDEANPQRAMREVLDLSAQTALKYYEREGYDEVTGKGRMGWSGTARKYLSKSSMELKPGLVFRRLHAWRDRVAREEDENPQYILPADIVKNLSMRLPTGLQAVRNMIGSRAPIAFSKVDQILKVVNAARSEWRREGRASSPPSDVVEAMYSKTKQTTEPATESNTDVWDAVQSSAPSMTGTSSLFGHTLKPAKAISAPAKKQISSLFGNIVSKRESEAAWASFATVQREVHTELEPALIIPLNSSDPAGTTSVQQESAFEPETVPFILPGSRTTLPPILHEPVLSIEDDGVVPVKRKQAKKRKEVVTHEIADLTTSVIPPAFNTEEVTASGSIDDLPPMPDEGPPISGKSKKQSRPAPDQNTKRETVVTTDFASLVTNPLEPAANSKASTSTDVVPEVVESLVPLADQAPPTRNLAIKVLRKMQSRMLEVQASPNMPAEPVVRENKKRKAKVTPQISSLISSAGPSSLPGDETDDADDSHEGVPTAPATEQVGDDLPAVQDASPPSLPKVRRKRKEKINTEDIPEFDYADEPNLLDHPGKFQKQGKGQGREKKKAKAKPDGLDGGLGRAPVDRSQPREGNRSGTFA